MYLGVFLQVMFGVEGLAATFGGARERFFLLHLIQDSKNCASNFSKMLGLQIKIQIKITVDRVVRLRIHVILEGKV
jgi:hypothetical protein